MGMLLYMADLERQKKAQAQENRAEGATTKKVAPKPVPNAEEKKPEEDKNKKPSRMEIMRMNVATVREYATKQGIEGANAMSGAELKRILVNKMFEDEDEE